MSGTWKALYETTAVGVYVPLVLPALFLATLAVRGSGGAGLEPRAAGFVRGWATVFALEAMLDPIATGLLGWPLLPFVLLGDYRVFALVLVIARPDRPRGGALAEAVVWTLVVPLTAYGLYRMLGVVFGAQAESVLWLIYEVAFALLALVLMTRVISPRAGGGRDDVQQYLRLVTGVVLAYYVLWAVADVLILAGFDWGWAVRIVPNLLYYGAFVPIAYAGFLGPRSAASRTSVQAAR